LTSVGEPNWKKSLRWLPGVLISLIAIFFVSRLVQWDELGPALKVFSWIHIAGMIGLTIAFLILRAAMSQVLLAGRPTLMDAFWAINQGYLLNNILPFRLGEIGRAMLLSQRTGLPAAQILSSIIIERALDVAIAAGMLLAMLPVALDAAWAKPVAVIMLIIVAAAMLGLFLVARYHEKVNRWVEILSARWTFTRKWVGPQVRSLLTGLNTLTDPRRFFLALALLLGSWVVAIGIYQTGLLAINPRAPLWWGVFTDAVLALGIAIPSAPAALGTFEAAVVGALSILGIGQTVALGYAITVHFVQIIITGILGMIGMVRQGRSIGTVFRDLVNRKETA